MLVNEFSNRKYWPALQFYFNVWLCSVIRVFLVLCDRLHPPSFDRLSLACSHTPPAWLHWGWDTSACKAPGCKPWSEPSCIFSSTHSPLRPSYTSLSSLWNPQWGQSQPDVGCFFSSYSHNDEQYLARRGEWRMDWLADCFQPGQTHQDNHKQISCFKNKSNIGGWCKWSFNSISMIFPHN